MKLAALQPAYLPWLGHLEQVHLSDKFVLLGNLQFSKGAWVNRNRMLVNEQPHWLTIPIKNGFKKKINEIEISNSQNWSEQHIKTISLAYGESSYSSNLVRIIKKTEKINLLHFIYNVNLYIYKLFNFEHKIELRNDLSLFQDKNARLISLCKEYGASQYISGESARKYIDLAAFKMNDIEVIFQDYKPMPYKQKSDTFVPFLSVIDCLLNGYSPSSILQENFFNANKLF